MYLYIYVYMYVYIYVYIDGYRFIYTIYIHISGSECSVACGDRVTGTHIMAYLCGSFSAKEPYN